MKSRHVNFGTDIIACYPNASILIIDDADRGDVLIMDASKMVEPHKDGKLQVDILFRSHTPLAVTRT